MGKEIFIVEVQPTKDFSFNPIMFFYDEKKAHEWAEVRNAYSKKNDTPKRRSYFRVITGVEPTHYDFEKAKAHGFSEIKGFALGEDFSKIIKINEFE